MLKESQQDKSKTWATLALNRLNVLQTIKGEIIRNENERKVNKEPDIESDIDGSGPGSAPGSGLGLGLGLGLVSSAKIIGLMLARET